MEQQAVGVVDVVAAVEMEVIGMMPTKMMQLLMPALIIIIMCRVQHQRLQTIPMLLDGALVISLLIMQLPTIIGLILSVHLNDARVACSSCQDRQKTRTEEKVDDAFVPVILVAINTIQNAQTKKAMVALLDTGSMRSIIHRSCLPSAATPTPLSKKP
eukprot:scaffold68204_cov103-Attheya_sp.AAC.2